MHRRFSATLGLFVLTAVFVLPTTVQAQSAIAGVVRDTTGGVLPGVTVEATSPALIEKARAVVSDDQGQYRIVDLRPGAYVVTFALAGFSTVRREGIELETNFTANVNVEMRVGALEETLTVSGETPVVDIQSTQRREVLGRALLDALPAARNFSTNTVPAITRSADVGGLSAMSHAGMNVYGSNEGNEILVDGMSMVAGSGQPGVFYNYGANEEVVYQMGGGSAEASSGGVTINMIPRQGGNEFKGDALGIFANRSFQGSNYSDELKTRGLTSPAALHKLWDVNPSLGGPIKRDKLWFFSSWRDWAANNVVADAFNKDGSQMVEGNHLWNLTNRVTYQLTQGHKVTGLYERMTKNLSHLGIRGGVQPEAARIFNTLPANGNTQLKWTWTASNRLLVESGYSQSRYTSTRKYQPEVAVATCFVAFAACPAGTNYGDIAKRDLIRDTQWSAPFSEGEIYILMPHHRMTSSISYVTGAHALKTGVQWAWGFETWGTTVQNGDIVQQYRNGVPDSVVVQNSPQWANGEGIRGKLDRNLGVYVQDSWTIRRLTLSPGIRYDQVINSMPEQIVPAGRFVPARTFAPIPEVINFQDISPRVGVAYDLFGDGQTAIKGSFGKYPIQEMTRTGLKYNPLVTSLDTRTWNDVNRDDIAQENEIGPSTNNQFGLRRNVNPDPDLRRVSSWLYNVGVQRGLWSGAGLSVTYNRRTYSNLSWTDNLATTVADYTLITIPDPRGNGQTLPVYNLNRARLGLIDELDTNSNENNRIYDGVDASLTSRFGKGTFMVGASTGRLQEKTCEVEDPNLLRFCDQTQLDIPFRTSYRAVGSYTLPYGFLLSGVFQRVPGGDLPMTYSVGRAIVPTLTLTSVTVRLDEPGTRFREDINQVDLVIGKSFQFGRARLQPKVELFNVFNANPVLTENTTFGSSLGRPQSVLPARFVRLNVQVNF